MKLNGPTITRLASRPAAFGIRTWMRTLNYRALYEDETVDPMLCRGAPRIYVFWHENILIPLHLRGHCHIAMLLSRHRDADILARIAGRFGFECVRGSTYRGGVRALRELAERSRTRHLTITPDGPRGPRRKLAQGAVYLASRLQMPIVCLGMGYSRPWRMNSWDRFAVPKPFSRARAVVSGEITVPAGLDRFGIEEQRRRVERVLNNLTDDAQAWAASGARRLGERLIRRGQAPPPLPVDGPKIADLAA